MISMNIFLLRDKKNNSESFWIIYPVILGILAFFSSSFSREIYHPWRPPNRSPKDSQGSHADTESDRSTAFQITVDHSKDPDPSGYHAWLWNLWSLDGGTSLISRAKYAVESNNFNPLLLNSHQGLYSKSWTIFREKKVPDNRVRSLS